jgi:hypothetical protein
MSKEELRNLIIELKKEISLLKGKVESIENRNYKLDLRRKCNNKIFT